MTNDKEQKILTSWEQNASPWIAAIDKNQIVSRRLVTDKTIIETITSLPIKNIIDIGCGEGWLARELQKYGISTLGIDATERLIQKAKTLGKGSFKVMEYEDLSGDSFLEKQEAAVCNFSLIGKDSVEHIFKTLPLVLRERGYLIIQTLHPTFSCGNSNYVDGWRDGSWDGFNQAFTNPAPWYFRTIASWLKLYTQNGFEIEKIMEPLNPTTGQPASLILVGHLPG